MTYNPCLDIISEFQRHSWTFKFSSQNKRFSLHKKEHAQIWGLDAIKCQWTIDNTHNTR